MSPSPRGRTHACDLAVFALITPNAAATTQEHPEWRLMALAVDQDLALVLNFAFIASSIADRYSNSSAVAFRANLYSFCAAANSALEGLTRTGRITGLDGADCNWRAMPARSSK